MLVKAVDLRPGDLIAGVGFVQEITVYPNARATNVSTKIKERPKFLTGSEYARTVAAQAEACYVEEPGSVNVKLIGNKQVSYIASYDITLAYRPPQPHRSLAA